MSKLVGLDGKEITTMSVYNVTMVDTTGGETYTITTPFNVERLLWGIRNKFNEINNIDMSVPPDPEELSKKAAGWTIKVDITPEIEIPEETLENVKRQITAKIQLESTTATKTEEDLKSEVDTAVAAWVSSQTTPFEGAFMDVVYAIGRIMVIPDSIAQAIHLTFNNLMHSSSMLYAHVSVGLKLPGTEDVKTMGMAFSNSYLDPTVDNAKQFKADTEAQLLEYWKELIAPDIIKN